jgi:hypothetical protein
MIGRVQLDCLDDSIPRRDRAHHQIVAGVAYSLMMARVNLLFNPVIVPQKLG